MTKVTEVRIWIKDDMKEGKEYVAFEDISKIVEEMKEKIRNLHEGISVVGMTTMEDK